MKGNAKPIELDIKALEIIAAWLFHEHRERVEKEKLKELDK